MYELLKEVRPEPENIEIETPEEVKENFLFEEKVVINEERFNEEQKKFNKLCKEQWTNEIKPLLKQQLINPRKLWEYILGGKEHREFRKSPFYSQESSEKHDIDFFNPSGFDRFAKVIEENAAQKNNPLKEYSSEYRFLYINIEQIRIGASEGDDITSNETEQIKKFYEIRDNFIRNLDKQNEAAIDRVKNEFLKQVNATLEKMGSLDYPQNKESIRIQVKIDMVPVILPAMKKLSEELLDCACPQICALKEFFNKKTIK